MSYSTADDLTTLAGQGRNMVDLISRAPIFRVHCEVADSLDLGPTPFGHRRVVNLLGGTVTGPKLNGRVLPGGTDMQIMAQDGSLDVHARYTLESDAGALIQVDSRGVRHGPADVLARLAKGEDVDPSLYYFRTVMRFETAHPSTDWLSRILALARGQREKNAVRLDVYEVL
jgi:uncharacterized protein DUF3237